MKDVKPSLFNLSEGMDRVLRRKCRPPQKIIWAPVFRGHFLDFFGPLSGIVRVLQGVNGYSRMFVGLGL